MIEQRWLVLVMLMLLNEITSSRSVKNSDSTTVDPLICSHRNLSKADLCGEKLFFVGKNSRLFPTNEAELEKYCAQTISLMQCVKRYTDKCALNEIQKQLANVMMYTVRSNQKLTCGSKTKRIQMTSMAKCVNSIRKQSTECMNEMLKEFGQAYGLQEQKNRVPYACCSFHKMKQCIVSSAEKQSNQICDKKSMEYFEQHIANMAGNTLQLMCSEYDDTSDKCGKIVKLPFNRNKVQTPTSLLKAFGDLLLIDGH